MEDNIKKLEFLTEQLIDHVPVINARSGYKEYETAEGCAIALALKNRPNCAVADVRMTKNSCFEWHAHNETEILVVFLGELLIMEQGKEDILLKESECIRFIPDTIHRVKAMTDLVKLIAITVPSSIVYPDM